LTRDDYRLGVSRRKAARLGGWQMDSYTTGDTHLPSQMVV
jgi:hypothetical protein